MKNDLVSIIVPIYNAEKYLDKALDSVRQQTYQDIEAILVDDGSTDSSAVIYQKYADSDSRFKVYRLENGGVSRARNHGLNYAKGRYVIFLDSDDWLEVDAVERLVGDSVKLSCDFLIASYNDAIKGEVITRHLCDNECIVKPSIDSKVLESCLLRATTPWAKLYDLQIIKDKGIRFDEAIKFGEDLIFNIQYISCIEKVRMCRSVVYNYRIMAEGSAQTKYFKDMAQYRISVAEAYLKYISTSGSERLFVKLLGTGIGHYCLHIYDNNTAQGISELILYFKDKINFKTLCDEFGCFKAALIKLGLGKVLYYLVKLKKQSKKKR